MSKLFSLIYNEEVRSSSDQKVIPAEDFSTLMEAIQIVAKAKEDAENLRQETEVEAAEKKKASQEAGFQEGLNRLNQNILALDQEKKRLRHEMNKLILPLALKAAKKIVAKELETHPETIVDIVLQAITPVLQNKKIVIYVNKVDRDILENNKPRIKERLEQVETLSVKERPDVSPGGCVIETESGIINASIENQWNALEAAFERYLKQ